MVNLMFNDIENKLKDFKSTYENIEVPDTINQYIYYGIEKGKRNKRKSMMRRISSLVATIFIIALLVSIRVSPSFATYISEIPGLEYLVKLVNYDKGLQLAIKNQFIQNIGVSDEHGDIKFTVDSIIADESRMIVFYTIDKGDRKIQLSRVELLDDEGGHISASYSIPGYNDKTRNEKSIKGKIDISFSNEGEIPNQMTMKVKLREFKKVLEEERTVTGIKGAKRDSNELPYTWEIKIPIDKERFKDMEEIFTINKEVEIEGQRIYFEGLIIYPTRIALDVKFHEDNSMKIFSFEDLRILDEKGEWLTISNGVTATYINQNTRRLYFQSNYFTNPKEIYIEGSKVRALDKDKLDVIVDLEKEKIIKSPDDKIKLNGVLNTKEGLKLNFLLRNEENINHHFDIFDGSFKDASGKVFKSLGITEFYPIEGERFNESIGYYIPVDLELQNPITLQLVEYPNRISKPFKIKVK